MIGLRFQTSSKPSPWYHAGGLGHRECSRAGARRSHTARVLARRPLDQVSEEMSVRAYSKFTNLGIIDPVDLGFFGGT